MARTLSATARQALYAQETGEVFLLLLTIDHATLESPIRVANNFEDIVSNGNTYVAFPFQITLPDDLDDHPPAMRLSIDNVDRAIVEAVRSIASPPTITLDVILVAAPDTVEASFTGFTLRNCDYDALVVEGDLALEDVLNEPFPAGSFTPDLFPSAF